MLDGALEAHRRYLVAMQAACSEHPRAHSHQLAALERELGLAAGAESIAGYRAASEDLFELTRAAWLDRAANHARSASAVGDRWSAEAAAIEYGEALGATGHADWGERVAAGSVRAAALRTTGAQARASFTGLLLCLLGLHSTGHEVEREEWRGQALGAYEALRGADPAFAWAELPSHARYRLRVPWADSGLRVVGGWIDDLDATSDAGSIPAQAGDPLGTIGAGEERWRGELAGRGPGAATGNEPTLDDVIAPYRQLASLTGDDRSSLAMRGAAQALVAAGSAAPTPHDALAGFVADGLLVSLAAAPLRARAEDALDRQSVWAEPLAAHHWRALLDHLDRALTPTEVELVSVHLDACFAVEADWNALLLGSLLGPLRAACTYGWDGSEQARSGLELAAGATYSLVGVGPRGVLGVPRVADFVARNLVPLVRGEPLALGAFEGEAGFDLLEEARAFFAAERTRGHEEPGDASALSAALTELFDGAGVEEPRGLPQPVTLWGESIALADLLAALASPARPRIPGLESSARAGSEL